MRAKPYFKTRFRVRVAKESLGDHWQGGPTTQKGANCPVCEKPLLLLWDVNAEDTALIGSKKSRFGGLKRLPLFFCWGCVGDLSYEVVSENEVRVIGSTGQANGGAEYEGYPKFFPRQPIAFSTNVPEEVRTAIKKWGPDGFAPEGFKETEHYKRLVEFFGHPVFLMRCMFHHQFGGLPLTDTWDDEAFECPNAKCPGGLLDRVRGRKRPMRFLAGVLNDPLNGLPMVEPVIDRTATNWEYTVSVQFHMCDKCYAITAANRCT